MRKGHFFGFLKGTVILPASWKGYVRKKEERRPWSTQHKRGGGERELKDGAALSFFVRGGGGGRSW